MEKLPRARLWQSEASVFALGASQLSHVIFP